MGKHYYITYTRHGHQRPDAYDRVQEENLGTMMEAYKTLKSGTARVLEVVRRPVVSREARNEA